MNTQIVSATEADIPALLDFIRQLATYEKLAHEVTATEEGLRHALFGARPYAEAIFLKEENVNVGFALFFHNFSTFVGKPGLYLEDLFVLPTHRGRGYGKRLLSYLANLAIERDCGRFEWWVLNWNKPAIDLYLSLGSEPKSEWTVHRLSGPALVQLASQGTKT